MSLAGPGTRILLAGTGGHVQGGQVPDVPAVRRTIEDLRRVLEQRCGAHDVVSLVDPDPGRLQDALIDAADQATDVLLFVFAGHGLVGLSGELYLATASTDHYAKSLATKALPFSAVREALAGSRARSIVVVLDCCFAGRALSGPVRLASLGGTYLLAASARDEQALAPSGAEHTAFSGHLIRFLRHGDPAEPAVLTLEGAFRHLSRALPKDGFPSPVRQLSGHVGSLALAGNPAAPPATGPKPPDAVPGEPCPYRGLDSFGVTDSHLFHGREQDTADLVRRVTNEGGIIAVVGPSGVGKSSLVQAGLVAAVGGDHAVITPGEQPCETLARHSGKRLLVVDQFEEIFGAGEDERRRFVDALPHAATTVVLAVRADYYGRCLAYPALKPALDSPFNVEPMRAEQLREVIEQPARVSGLELEHDLAGLLLHDLHAGDTSLRDPSGALPLLSYALMATWERRDGNRLTLAGYRATGGIWGAVTQRADAAYASLDAANQREAKSLLLRMVRIVDGVEDARRRIAVTESPALTAFTDARLITVTEHTAQIAHEALLRVWPTLRTWIAEDRAGLLVHQQLSEAAQQWQRSGKDKGHLFSGRRLVTTREWLSETDNHTKLTDDERTFLTTSARQQRRRKALAVVGVLALLFGIGAAVVAVRQSNAAADRGAQLTSRQLAAQASVLRGTDPNAALHMSLAAYKVWPTKEARDAVQASYATAAPQLLRGHSGFVVNLAFSPDGRTLVSSADDRTIRLWDFTDPRTPVAGPVLPSNGTAAIAFSPDGRTLAAHSAFTMAIWDLSDPRNPVRKASAASEVEKPMALAFHQNGHTVATGSHTGEIRLWEITPQPVVTKKLAVDTRTVESVAFSPDGRTLAAKSASGTGQLATVRLWGVENEPAVIATLADVPAVRQVVFSPDGTKLAAGGVSGKLLAWDVSDPRAPKPVSDVSMEWDVDKGSLVSLAFSDDGASLVAASTTGTVHSFEFTDLGPRRRSPLPGSAEAGAVAVMPGSQGVAVAGAGGTIRYWRQPGPPALSAALPSHVFSLPGSVFGADGRTLATLAKNTGGNVQLWDVTDFGAPRKAATLDPAVHAAFVQDSTTLMTFVPDRSAIQFWDAHDPDKAVKLGQVTITGSRHGDTDVRIRDGVMVLTNSKEHTATLWDISNPARPVRRASVRDAAKISTTLLLTRDQMATWTPSGLHLWDTSDLGNPRFTFTVPRSGLLDAVGYVSERELLIGVTGTGEVVFWDMPHTGAPTKRKTVLPLAAQSTTVVGDGNILALSSKSRQSLTLVDITDVDEPQTRAVLGTAAQLGYDLETSRDRTLIAGRQTNTTSPGLHIWDVTDPDNAEETLTLPIDAKYIEFHPKRKAMAVGVNDPFFGRSVRLWELDPGAAYARLCQGYTSALSEEEWTRAAPRQPFQPPC